MLNNFVEKEKTFEDKIKSNKKKSIFFKRVDPCFWLKKCNFFHYLFSLKIRLEVRFNNFLDRKKKLEIVLCNFVEKNETSFEYKNGMFQSP